MFVNVWCPVLLIKTLGLCSAFNFVMQPSKMILYEIAACLFAFFLVFYLFYSFCQRKGQHDLLFLFH